MACRIDRKRKMSPISNAQLSAVTLPTAGIVCSRRTLSASSGSRCSERILERRRTLRYRHLLVRQMVQMKNRVSGLLMETGVSHNKQRLHKIGYFPELLANADCTTLKPRDISTSPLRKLRV